MPSFRSRLMPAVMTLRGSQRIFRSAAKMRHRVAVLQEHPQRSAPPVSLAKEVDIRVFSTAGWVVYEISPRHVSEPRKRALYLHGGAYVFEIAPQHWRTVASLVALTGTRFVVPLYALAPAETAASIVPKAAALAAALIDEVGAEHTSILGDSAGGGMALAVAMLLRDRGLPPLQRTVLISPWLDISGSDPALKTIQPRDPWLAVPGSRAAGEIYRGTVPENDPRVSPIHGDLAGLGAISMFSGTRDILNADARMLLRLAAQQGKVIDYHEGHEMIHVYPILPIPEGRAAIRVIAGLLMSERQIR